MPTQLLAVGTTAADSADVVVASGSTVTIGLKGIAAGAAAVVTLKDDGGGYNSTGNGGRLDTFNPVLVINAAGTYRVSRLAGGACGVFSA